MCSKQELNRQLETLEKEDEELAKETWTLNRLIDERRRNVFVNQTDEQRAASHKVNSDIISRVAVLERRGNEVHELKKKLKAQLGELDAWKGW